MQTYAFGVLCGLTWLAACHAEIDAEPPALIAKLSPSAVSTADAWKLFDRSASSGFTPDSTPVVVELDRAQPLAAIKVLGASPYQLDVRGHDDSALGFDPIDLSKLDPGWHVIPTTSLTQTDHVELHFVALGRATPVAELELWGQTAHLPAPSSAVDLTGRELPAHLVTFAAAVSEDEVAPDACASFDVEVSRSPRGLRSAYLVYDARGLFRGWTLRRSVNGLADQGGAWLVDDAAVRSVVDRLDPEDLRLGTNTVRLCAPAAAHGHVKLSNVRIVGELDTGIDAIDTITVGERDGTALVDDDLASTVEIAAGERVALGLERLTSVDALVLTGPVASTPAIDCVAAAGVTHPVTIHTQRTDTGSTLALEGASSCVALNLTFPLPTTLAALDVVGSGVAERVDWPRIVVTSTPEHFGAHAWVSGFVALPRAMTGAVQVTVGDDPATSATGVFGTLLARPDAATAWPVTVTARLPDGTTQTRQLVLDRDARAQLDHAGAPLVDTTAQPDSRFGRLGEKAVVQAASGAATKIRLGTVVGADVPAGALAQATAISIAQLPNNAMPPLDPGMVNVTAPKDRGYEFLPHGQRFAKPIEVTVPYDPTLIPKDMRDEDVHTYFYDPDAKQWKQLPRNAIDLGEHVARSATTHFTIMIDAVLAVPKNPTPMAFDPSALANVTASATAGIDLIEPPHASQTGDANVALPIRIPAGRGAYTPNLSIAYSSVSGNGWLGVGWDLSLGRVSIDTRWGVPQFLGTERYLLDSNELIPVDENEGPRCQDGSAGQRFRPRVESSFAHVIRCEYAQGGLDPIYHWEVVDRDGTLFVYGEDPHTDTTDPRHSSLADPANSHHITSWWLQKVVDVHGNTTIIHYAEDDISVGEPAMQLYPASIAYTSNGALTAAYQLTFQLDDGTRPDAFSSGRDGFKTVTRRLLRGIHIAYRGTTIRDYILTYAHGQFQKSTLASVQVYGTDGCAASATAFVAPACAASTMLDQHTFEYQQETEGFTNPYHLLMAGLDIAKAMPIATRHATNRSGEISAGVNYGGLNASIGGGVSIGERDETNGLYDMNGDGLPDQVFMFGNEVTVLYNKNTPDTAPDAHNLFESDASTQVVGLSSLASEGSWGWDLNAGISDLGSFSGVYSQSTARASGRMLDVDGDGYLDKLGHFSLLGGPCAQNTCFSSTAYGAIDGVDPYADPVLGDMATSLHDQLVMADPVVQWTAPLAGHVIVSGTAQKHQAGGTDGVTLELYRGDALLEASLLVASDVAPHAFPADATGLDVVAGDTVYLRVKTGADDAVGPGGVSLDRVDADLHVDYQTTCIGMNCTPIANLDNPMMTDPNGSRLYAFSSRADHRVAGSPTFVVAPVKGTFTVSATISKGATAAAVHACVQHFPAATPGHAPQLDVGCRLNAVGTRVDLALSADSQPLQRTVAVDVGEIVLVRIESDLSYDPASIRLDRASASTPIVNYTQVCLPENGGTCTSDPDSLAAAPLPSRVLTDFGPFITLVPPATTPYIAPDSGFVFLNAISPGKLGTLRISTDRQGTVFWYVCPTGSCSAVTPPMFAVSQGEAIYFEGASSPASGANSVNGSINGFNFSTPVSRHTYGESTTTVTPFAGGYHGWRFGLWNEAQPFAPTEVIADYPNLATLPTTRQQEVAASISPVLATFGHLVTTELAPAWNGSGSLAYVAAGAMNAGYIGLVPDGGNGADSGGLLAGEYARLASTRSYTLGVGLASVGLPIFGTSLGVNVGASDTTITTDALDMNGDGVVDILAGTQLTLGAMSNDPQGFGHVRLLEAGGGLRKTHGFDYSIKLGGGLVIPFTSSGGHQISEVAHKINFGGIGSNHYVGYGVGRSETTSDLIDVNGDGLPDLVRRDGPTIKVQLNLGNRFGAEEPFGSVAASLLPSAAPIDAFQQKENDIAHWTAALGLDAPDTTTNALEHETTITEHDVDAQDYVVYSSSRVTTKTWSRTTRQIEDLNGDGLPDLVFKRDIHGATVTPNIIVQYNYGGSFGPPVEWQTPAWDVAIADDLAGELSAFGLTGPDVLAGSSSTHSSSHTSSLSIPIPSTPFTVGGSYDTQTSDDTVELGLADLDGDGAPDHVLRRQTAGGTPTVYVKYNQVTGGTNLLRVVHRPLGGSFTLAYRRTGNTTTMPHSRHVLAAVTVDDGVDLGAGFSSPSITTTFQYGHGVFARNEKEFFGFGQVQTLRSDGLVVEDDFENQPDQYALHGRLLHEYTRFNGALQEQHDLTYTVLPVTDASDNVVFGNHDCTLFLPTLLARVTNACTPGFPVVTQDAQTRFETSGSKTHTTLALGADFDRFGNLRASTDCGDDAIANDGIYATAAYQSDPTRWILGEATSLQVHAINSATCVAGGGVGALLRSRTGDYDAYGEVQAIHVDTGSGVATSVFGYDLYGNLDHIETPPNESAQIQTYDITFDPDVATYPIRLLDGFGYASTASYDLRFGVATQQTDTNSATRTTYLDRFGRVYGVRGPYDTVTSGIAITYDLTTVPASASLTQTAGLPPGYTGARPPTTATITFVDGLGREIEVNKFAVVNGATGTISSGFVSRDAIGRVARTQLPFFTAGLIPTFIAPHTTQATTYQYDSHDRQQVVTYPDLAAVTTTYDIATSPTGVRLFSTQTRDENGHVREVYADLAGRTRAFVEHPSATVAAVTAYDYLPTGELSQITDAEGHITALQYDLRGSRTRTTNPDEGQIDEQFDLMGNRTALVEPNHRALDTRIHYVYDRNRLAQIDYPTKQDVTYTYGDPGAPTYGAGRITSISDESGQKTLEYGAMGEVVRTTRTVVDSTVTPPTTTTFDVHAAYDSLGQQLQLVYPDGEIVSNLYDLAGRLTKVAGTGSGWSRTYASNFRYNELGDKTSVQYGNGVTSSWTFDPLRARLATLRTVYGTTRLQDLAYSYDRTGNPTTIANNLPASPIDNSSPGTSTQSYVYDGADQLLSATGSGTLGSSATTNFALTFTYSPSRNITLKNLSNVVTDSASHTTNPVDSNYSSTYSYAGAAHLPSSIGDTTLTYDPSGNPVQRSNTAGLQRLTWDDDNRLAQVQGWGASQRNLYDASGSRVVRNGADHTIFVDNLFEFNTLTTGTKHIYAAGTHIASAPSSFASSVNPTPPTSQGSVFYVHQTHLGSVGVVTTSTGTVNDAHEYFPDGAAWIDSGVAHTVNGILFNAKPFDTDTKLYDFGQRFYDPKSSLWLSNDASFRDGPMAAVGSPHYLAVSAFAANNPMSFTDEDGRDARTPQGILLRNESVMLGGRDAAGYNYDTLAAQHLSPAAAADLSYEVLGKLQPGEKSWEDSAANVFGGAGDGLSFVVDTEQMRNDADIHIVNTNSNVYGCARVAGTGGAMFVGARSGNEPVVEDEPVVQDQWVRPARPYNRRFYGGHDTEGPAAQAIRQGAEGTACPNCARSMLTGTETAPVPEHSPSLVEDYYENNGHLRTPQQAKAYANSAEAFDGAVCKGCQDSQGAEYSAYSKFFKRFWGFDQ